MARHMAEVTKALQNPANMTDLKSLQSLLQVSWQYASAFAQFSALFA